MNLNKDFKLIPVSEITDEAKEIAVRWVEDFQDSGGLMIEEKHKLASDIMNYAQLKISEAREEKWISVEDSLPEPHLKVLVHYDNNELMGILDEVNGWNIFYSDGLQLEDKENPITHWKVIISPKQ